MLCVCVIVSVSLVCAQHVKREWRETAVSLWSSDLCILSCVRPFYTPSPPPLPIFRSLYCTLSTLAKDEEDNCANIFFFTRSMLLLLHYSSIRESEIQRHIINAREYEVRQHNNT